VYQLHKRKASAAIQSHYVYTGTGKRSPLKTDYLVKTSRFMGHII